MRKKADEEELQVYLSIPNLSMRRSPLCRLAFQQDRPPAQATFTGLLAKV